MLRKKTTDFQSKLQLYMQWLNISNKNRVFILCLIEFIDCVRSWETRRFQLVWNTIINWIATRLEIDCVYRLETLEFSSKKKKHFRTERTFRTVIDAWEKKSLLLLNQSDVEIKNLLLKLISSGSSTWCNRIFVTYVFVEIFTWIDKFCHY